MQRMRRTRKTGMAGKVIHKLICLIYRARLWQDICAACTPVRQQQRCPVYVYARVPRRRKQTIIR